MRVLPIVTASIVMAALYLLVFERDRIVSFAAGDIQETLLETANSDSPEPPEPVAGEIAVVAIRSRASEIANAIIVRGRTEAARQVDVKSETSGLVISDPFRKGAHVETGQILCQLDPGTREISLASASARLAEAEARVPEAQSRFPEAKARLAEALARKVEAEINLRAAQRLSEDGFASEARLASAEAAYEAALASVQAAKSGVAGANSGVQAASAGVQAAVAGVASAEREITRLAITAPFGGLLESDTAEIGSLLQPGALCATIIQLDPIKLVGFVPETEVAQAKVGVLAGARLATGQEVSGTVTFISRSADETTRTFRIEVKVPNRDLAIRDGQTAEIIIASDGSAAHLLPMSSLTLDDQGQLGVRTVDQNSRALFAAVEVLRDTPQGIWVSGLPTDVEVIVVGQEFVVDGVPVAVTYREPSQ